MPYRGHRPFRSFAVVAGGAALALTSCGADPSDPRGLTREFVEAMQERDWDAACENLSHDFVHRATDGDSRYCAYYLEQWHGESEIFHGMTVPRQTQQAREDGTVIRVDLADGSTDEAIVVEEGGELRLSRYPGQETAAR
ncbi:hypothetical protein FCK90_12590 [Kocuria coralli]|uniref:Nuclear transport factor 2 family protein n=1 Tax=Kocuria coralli TaxID=1461025 RepID=A0A5J5KUY8_9MICC|nr:hypothetical protein [Kocuria coralli]KAA9393342.1 hypothetical protein FCK90_12590 [Kocuria coralli]